MLEIFLTKDAQVEDLCGAPSCSEVCLFFSNDLPHLQLQSDQYGLQHDFARVADEADRSIVLALLHVAFIWNLVTKDWVQGVGHSPVCQILLQIVVRAWISSAGMLSTPAGFPFFSGCIAASISSVFPLHLN